MATVENNLNNISRNKKEKHYARFKQKKKKIVTVQNIIDNQWSFKNILRTHQNTVEMRWIISIVLKSVGTPEIFYKALR